MAWPASSHPAPPGTARALLGRDRRGSGVPRSAVDLGSRPSAVVTIAVVGVPLLVMAWMASGAADDEAPRRCATALGMGSEGREEEGEGGSRPRMSKACTALSFRLAPGPGP